MSCGGRRPTGRELPATLPKPIIMLVTLKSPVLPIMLLGRWQTLIPASFSLIALEEIKGLQTVWD